MYGSGAILVPVWPTWSEWGGQLLDDCESLLRANTTAAADDNLRFRQRHAAGRRSDVFGDLHHEVASVEFIDEPLDIDLDRSRPLCDTKRVRRNGDERPRAVE